MPRKLLLFAALAVVGSMLVLWFATRDRKSEPSASTVAAATPSGEYRIDDPRGGDRPRPELAGEPGRASDPRPPITEHGDRNPRSSDPGRPYASTVESTERGANPGVTTAPLEYTLPDGRRVRDFRTPENRQPLEVPPSIHAPGGRRIKPDLTGLYSEEIQKHMHECGKAVPKDVLGAKPRLEGQIVIAIKAGQGSVTSAVFKLTEVSSAAIADTAKQCVEQKALTVSVPAPDEADLDSYSINLSFAFR